MFKIATLNKISPVGLSHLTDNYTITENVDEANAILVRSQAMHDMDFSDNLLPTRSNAWQEPAQE